MDFCKISLENSGMYTIPISELIKKRKLNYYLYAGDTQTYVAFEIDDIDTFTDRISDCGSDISLWMERNELELTVNARISTQLQISARFELAPLLGPKAQNL